MTSISEVPKPEASKQLFVRSKGVSGQKLPPPQVLQTFLSKFGTVVKITYGNKDCTFAFVTFLTAEQAKAAYDSIHGSEVVDASKGVNLGRTLFVDFAVKRGAKPVHVKTPKLTLAPKPAPEEAPKPAPAPREVHVEAPRPAPVEAPSLTSAPKEVHVEAPKPAPVNPQKPILDVAAVNLPMVYISQSKKSKIMSKSALGVLFDLRSSPQTKFQGDTPVQMFGNGDEWVIPHPEHPTATQDCQKAFEFGTYTEKLTVNIPKGVLESKKFWRD
jgi:hypothetical protein